MGLGPQWKDSKTFGTTVYGLTHPNPYQSTNRNFRIRSFPSYVGWINIEIMIETYTLSINFIDLLSSTFSKLQLVTELGRICISNAYFLSFSF